MALMVKCDKHGIGYISADLYPKWWRDAGIPTCPQCRLEWIEEYKGTLELPVSWDALEASARLELGNPIGLSDLGG